MTAQPTLNQVQYRDSLVAMLSSEATRIFFWRLIVEDCKVFVEDFPMNAAVYALCAKQEIGKRLLADAKALAPDQVYRAEQEYVALQKNSAAQAQTQGEN